VLNLHELVNINTVHTCRILLPQEAIATIHSGTLTLRLLMSHIYMELLVKPEMLTSYIYGPTLGYRINFHLPFNNINP